MATVKTKNPIIVCESCEKGLLVEDKETPPVKFRKDKFKAILRCTHCHAGWAGETVEKALIFHKADVKKVKWVKKFREAFNASPDPDDRCFEQVGYLYFCTSAYRKHLEHRIFKLEVLDGIKNV